jgi:energy-coupling factor transporter transmembrane protein EcfT
MAQLTAFSYIPQDTMVHTVDVRVKLALLMLVSLSVLGADTFGLGMMSFCLLAVIYYLRLPLKSICFELRYIVILLVLVFFARTVSTTGDPLITLKWFSISREGMHAGMLVVWRMALIVLLGLVFTATTSPYSIKAAIQWILKPIPRIPHARVATMMALMLRMIPLILTQASETMDAQQARGVENRKNPFYRIKNFSSPFLRRSFETADRMAIAMDARCYSDHRTDSHLKASIFDIGILSIAVGLCIVCYLI